jgi:hypothetical protein
VFANTSALTALGPFAPLPFGVGLGRHSGLAGKMHHHAVGNVLALIGESSVELEGLKQDGEAEPGGARFVAEQFTLVGGERPVLGELVRVLVLLHRK